jgi:hypothetical protein
MRNEKPWLELGSCWCSLCHWNRRHRGSNYDYEQTIVSVSSKNDSIVLENSHYGYSHLEKSASFQASQIHNVLQHFLGSVACLCAWATLWSMSCDGYTREEY